MTVSRFVGTTRVGAGRYLVEDLFQALFGLTAPLQGYVESVFGWLSSATPVPNVRDMLTATPAGARS